MSLFDRSKHPILALGALALFGAAPALASEPDYEEWWYCVDNCPEGTPWDAACVDECTNEFNEHNSHAMVGLEIVGNNATCEPDPTGAPTVPTIDVVAVKCPDGHTLTPFVMPIYDERGVFIIDRETVWFCIPDPTTPPQ